MTYDEIVEKIAKSWASMDGKGDLFESCKLDPEFDSKHGYYMGYIADAEELLKRSGIKKYLKLSE